MKIHMDAGVRLVYSACPRCIAGVLVLRRRNLDGDPFVGCSRYPECKFTASYDEYVGALVGVIEDLWNRIANLKKNGESTHKGVGLQDAREEIKKLIFRYHPDRSRSAHATEVTKVLNELRNTLGKRSR